MPFSGLKMDLWLLLAFTALAQCHDQRRSVRSSPDLCPCSFAASGADVVCSQKAAMDFPDCLPDNATRLSIQNTNLSSIAAQNLSAAPRLISLQLYHTNLDNLPADLLKDVPQLELLDLTGNRLVRLPPSIFIRDSLRSLVLKNNLIEKADAEWFSSNSSLTWLDLSGNHLASIQTGLLHKLPLLNALDLSFNKLEELQPDALELLHHLESLNLAGNRLITLKPVTFTHNVKLSQLFLQENQFQELPASLLRGLQNLELLLLNQNQLEHLPSGLLEERKSSFQVTLAGNPWVCDQKIQYLWKWLSVHRQNVWFLEEVTCTKPEFLKHRQVVSLTDSELGL